MSNGFRHYKWVPVDHLWRIFRPSKVKRHGKGKYWNGEMWVREASGARTYTTGFSAWRGVERLTKTYRDGETLEWGAIQAVLLMERRYARMAPTKQISAASPHHVAYVRALTSPPEAQDA